MKTATIRTKAVEREPNLYTIIFTVNGSRYKFQKVAFDLEKAVDKCAQMIDGKWYYFKTSDIWWSLSLSFSELKQLFKNI